MAQHIAGCLHYGFFCLGRVCDCGQIYNAVGSDGHDRNSMGSVEQACVASDALPTFVRPYPDICESRHDLRDWLYMQKPRSIASSSTAISLQVAFSLTSLVWGNL